MRWATAVMTRMLCSMTRRVSPPRCRSRTSCTRPGMLRWSTPPVTSSSRRTRGSVASARASSRRLRWPVESVRAYASAFSPSPTRSRSSRARARAQERAQPGEQALRGDAHGPDEHGPVDDQVDPHEPGPDAAEAGAQGRLEDRDEGRAEEWAEGRADAAEDREQAEADGEIHREDVQGSHEADALRPQGAAHGGERRADRDGRDLEAAGRHPEREGRVLVLAHRGELGAAARALGVELDEVEQDREAEDEGDPHSLVHDAERPEALAEGYRDALRPRGEAAPAARHDEQHLGERDRGQPEVGAAEPVAEKAEDEAERGGEHGADQQPDPGRHPPLGAEERGRVGAEPEEGGVAERDLAGVAARHVPGRPGRAPQQDQYEPVEEEGVADHDRPEGGRGEEGDGRPRAPHVPITSAPRWPNRPAGRTTRTVMNRRRYITSFHAVPIT